MVVKVMSAMAALVIISALALMVYRSEGASLDWQIGQSDPIHEFYPEGNGLYVISSSNISMVNDSGKVLWTIPFNGTQYSATGNNGQLYVYSATQGLNSIDPSGNISLVTRQGMNRPPIVGPDGTLYLRSWSVLSSISPLAGGEWNVTNVVSDPVIAGLGNIYFFMRPPQSITDVYLYCIAPNGTTRWSIVYQDYYASTLLKPDSSGGVLVYDESMGTLDHIDESGNSTWEDSMTYLGQYNLVEDNSNRLYMFFLWGTTLVLDDTGNVISKFNPVITYDANLSYQPVAYNNTIYVVGAGKFADSMELYALNIDGTLKWKQQLNSSISPTIYANNGIICFNTEVKEGSRLTPTMYVMNDDGDLMYTYTSGDGSLWQQVAISNNDTLYALTANGILNALKG